MGEFLYLFSDNLCLSMVAFIFSSFTCHIKDTKGAKIIFLLLFLYFHQKVIHLWALALFSHHLMSTTDSSNIALQIACIDKLPSKVSNVLLCSLLELWANTLFFFMWNRSKWCHRTQPVWKTLLSNPIIKKAWYFPWPSAWKILQNRHFQMHCSEGSRLGTKSSNVPETQNQ